MITYEWSDWRNGVFWWIQSVYVDPAWRRRGVFRRIHETVVSQAKADVKLCGIRLYVGKTITRLKRSTSVLVSTDRSTRSMKRILSCQGNA